MEDAGRHGFDRRKLIGVFVVAALIVTPFGGYEYLEHRSALPPLPIGSRFPSSVFTTLAHTVTTTDSLLAKKCLVAIISTQCPLCRKEILVLDSVWRSGGCDIVVLSLNSMKETERFKRDLRCALPIFLMNSEEARKRYHINSLPVLFFIGEHQEIRSIVSSIGVNTKFVMPIP
jgi:hypothetical protein